VLNPSFTGSAVKLVFGVALPSSPYLAGYFFAYIDRVTLYLSVIDSNVISNSVMLQMQPPTPTSNPWLILNDAINGILNSFRLGWSNQFSS
jgi:hypothetical protein